MKRILRLFRTTAFLAGLSFFLLTTTIGAIIWGVQTAAVLTAATSVAVKQAVDATWQQARVRQARAITKTKAKERIRRAVVAIPIIGLGAMVYFEERNFKEWQEDNPDGTRQEYGCEVVDMTAEVLEEVLQELPEYVRPKPETVFKLIPKCASEETPQN